MSGPKQSNRIRWVSVGILIVLLLVAGAAFAPRYYRSQKQAAIVAEIEFLGGKVTYDFEQDNPAFVRSSIQRMLGDDFFGTVVEVDYSHSMVFDHNLESLRELPDLKRLGLYDTNISDAGLERVGSLTQLEFLWLDKTKITDQGIRELAKLQNLRELLMQSTSITDAAMPDVARLRSLRTIGLFNTNVGDAGIARLAELKFESLYLSGTKITDASAATLAGFTGLTFLDLSETQVTDQTLKGAPHWQQLQMLRINDTAISDSGVDDLSSLGSLRLLVIGNTQITDEGGAQLRTNLPQCQVFQ